MPNASSTPAGTPDTASPEGGREAAACPAATGSGQEEAAGLATAELLSRLREDRLWLLRQIDGGRWPEWRLDLAALERELGVLLEQAEEHQNRR